MYNYRKLNNRIVYKNPVRTNFDRFLVIKSRSDKLVLFKILSMKTSIIALLINWLCFDLAGFAQYSSDTHFSFINSTVLKQKSKSKPELVSAGAEELSSIYYSNLFAAPRRSGTAVWQAGQMVLGFGLSYATGKGTSSMGNFSTNKSISSMIYYIDYEAAWLTSDLIGFGCKIRFQDWNLGKDSASQTVVPGAISYDFLGALNFHLVRTEKIDVPIGLISGFSVFKYVAKDQNNTTGRGKGGIYGFQADPRYYFNDHWGASLHLAYLLYAYTNIAVKSDVPNTYNSFPTYSMTGAGLNIGAGVQYKFR